jgi:hypothetical protein
MPKISHDEFQAFLREYYNGAYPHQRLGQAFLNKVFPSITHSELYYTESKHEAERIILEHYVIGGTT